jgi:folate-binding protein YgfZ
MSPFRPGPAIVHRTDRGLVRLRGGDRTTWLQGLVTNDVLAIPPGERSYGAWLTPQGRMITDLWAVPLTDAMLLDVPAPLAAALAQRLDGLVFAEDVQIDDASGEMAVLELYGSAAPRAVGQGVPQPCTDALAIVPDRTLGVPATVFYLPAASAGACTDALADANAAVVADLEAWDVLRIEAGVPKFFVDMTEETIPLEAGLEHRAISFAKGCYVGQEIIVRVTERGGGRVAKRLVGLILEGSHVPPPGAPIAGGKRSIGRVTSATFSPVIDRVIALGYVHRDFVDAGTPVEVIDEAHTVPAMVTALPFVGPAI